MKSLVIVLITALILLSSTAKEIAGDWNGILEVQGMQLTLIFHITETDDGYTATLDSPDQGAKGIPVSKVSFEHPKLEIQVAALGILYQGEMNSDGEVQGTFNQGGQSFPLTLSREVPKKKALNRPQEPAEPYPYESKEVSFASVDGVRLAGTLTLPNTPGPHPAVILISGSGPQNRDEEFMTHKPFLVLADHLTRNGIAVLRYDDRGTAESTGSFHSATSEDFALDVISAIRFLKSQDTVLKIGLIGHSEGGLIAPMVAANSSDIDFVVLLAGPGVPGDQVLLQQNQLLAKVAGKGEEQMAYGLQAAAGAFEIVKQNSDKEQLRNELKAYLTEAYKNPLAEVPEGMKAEDMIKLEVAQLSSPWMRFFVSYDPATALEQVKCPILALNGERDVQVSPENLDSIKQALEAGGNTRVTAKRYPKMNHLFQECRTGAISEYATIEQTISPEVLEDVSEWISKL